MLDKKLFSIGTLVLAPMLCTAYEIAEAFQYPVSSSEGIYTEQSNSGWLVAQDFQDCRDEATPASVTACTHLGEDWNYFNGSSWSNENRKIYAIANGYVVASGVKNGFAGYVILKHYLNPYDVSDYVLSIYGHMQTSNLPKKGEYFQKGAFIAKTATQNEMSQWTGFGPHLHFEIRKPKRVTGYNDSYLNDGYAHDYSNNYYDPTDLPLYDYETHKPSLPPQITLSGFIENFDSYKNSLINATRADALKLILDKFNISSSNAGYNTSRFGDTIIQPKDVNEDTSYYDYIVTAYNRGIVSGTQGVFRPDEDVSLIEFLIMIIRTIAIPQKNPNYASYAYDTDKWYYHFAKTAYNAGLIDDKKYAFSDAITLNQAKQILNSAYEYFMGPNSGISIYVNWDTRYADVDLYFFSQYDSEGYTIIHDSNHIVSNISELQSSNALVYWGNYSSDWGANLDYDSWGGNGDQPWAGKAEERVSVDSKMLRRPGEYSIIFCYYDWRDPFSPESVDVQWWGIQRGKNINNGGNNFTTNISKNECLIAGTLRTQ